MIARKGGDNPGQSRTAKTGHNALSAAGSAAGVMLPPYLTFEGVRQLKRLTKGVVDARAHLTVNGWPNGEGWFKFIQHIVEWMKTQGLTKLLLVVDGHDDHFYLPAILLMRANNIRTLVFCGGCTHKIQPLDVGLFGALEALLIGYISADFGVCNNEDWARHVARAYKHWETHKNKKGEHIMVASFRRAGLVPCNFGIFTDVDFARSDARLGLSADHEDVKKAKAMQLSELSLVIKSSAAASKPEVKDRLKKHVKATGFDLNMMAPTDDYVVIKLLDKAVAKDEKIAGLADRKKLRADKAADKIQLKKDKAADKIKKVEAKAAAAAAEEAAKSAAAAAKVAKAAAPAGGKKRARASEAVQAEAVGAVADPYAGGGGGKKRRA